MGHIALQACRGRETGPPMDSRCHSCWDKMPPSQLIWCSLISTALQRHNVIHPKMLFLQA